MEELNMDHCTPKIVVAGDVCIDWLRWRVSASDEGLNWQLYEGTDWAALPGGAALLAEMLRRMGDVDVRAPQLGDLRTTPPDQVLHSLADLELFPADPKSSQRVYRVARFAGYTAAPDRREPPPPLPIANDEPAADLVILDDAGNRFRSTATAWPAALTQAGADPLVIAKLMRPLLVGELWEHLRKRDPDRVILVINADHLREAGVNLSRQLSWERTAKDFVWQMACNPWLTPLANVRHLVVRFGLDAAIYYSSGPRGARADLNFDPSQVEGGFADQHGGQMQGYADAFVAALARKLACAGPANKPVATLPVMAAGLQAGLAAARQLLRLGYGAAADIPAFPSPAIFAPAPASAAFARVAIPGPIAAEPPDPTYWSILKDLPGADLEKLAEDLVRRGKSDALRGMPVGQFGKLRTADRAEIEGFRSLRNLVDEYLSGTTGRPLSVAVFGSPGSGKSFSVTQVAESVAGNRKITRLEFNLSQFRSLDDLCRAFHRVRDTVLEGATPLVFFDEFDSAFEGELGWLKYFLAPMQDGQFREGETPHPIGRAIFVFAGGTSSSFEEFSRAGVDTETAARFRGVKGPDFVSRLRGYVNILGLNPTDDGDAEYVLRRAMLLRSLIERKAPQLLDSGSNVRIDDGVLRALLRVPLYKHGARSLEAILDMSLLAGQSRWDPAALPPAEQLALHVDAELFLRLVLRDVLLTAARDALGQAIHLRFVANQRERKPAEDLAMQPWEALREDLRESNRKQADDIGAKLRAINCGMRPAAAREQAAITFSPAEVEVMAEMEHIRYVTERRIEGWVFGSKRDPERKISPYLVPYADLPEDVKEWDREAVRAIPEVLAQAKFEVYRLGGGATQAGNPCE
jgi:hypothetical protein